MIPLVVDAEDREMWCERCGLRHGVNWFTPSDVWNAVMREGDRGNPDEFGFCCPICFMQLADERGVGNHGWVIVPDPEQGPYPTLAGFLASGASVRISDCPSALTEHPSGRATPRRTR